MSGDVGGLNAEIQSKFRRQYDRATRRLASLPGGSFVVTRPLAQSLTQPASTATTTPATEPAGLPDEESA